ncbi:uncharacterized protein LOC143282639 [Babylonia areolata]|uniref:uncharacterized protein LOC143282639 n=1 Tax=Babylonia areolata TaxID=304850 RepID=UPI003FD02C77
MTRPFLTEEECRAPTDDSAAAREGGEEAEETTALVPPLPPPPQDNTMFTTRAKFSRFEVLPPVLCTRRVYVQVGCLLLVGLVIFLVRMIAVMRGTFVHYHLETDTDGELVILPSDFARKSGGAACLDGSPPAYYYRQSTVPGIRFWIIHLKSGGWCSTPEDCLSRSGSALGSSLKTKMSQPLEGIMSSDCSLNPDFCLWHMVDLLYCDGGSYLGNRSEPLIVDSKQLHMKGALVFDAVIDYLSAFTLFKDAEQIILAGSSAGALGALFHADRLRERLPSSVKTVHVVVDGGLLVDVADVSSSHTMAKILKDVFYFHHAYNSQGLKECARGLSRQEEWQCVLPEVLHKHVFTPLYFVNSLYDSWFRSNALRIACNVELCSDLNLKEVVSARLKLLQESEEILRAKKNGVFLTSCPGHTVLAKRAFFTVRAQGKSVREGLGDWLHHRGSGHNLTEVLEVSDALRKCPSLLL